MVITHARSRGADFICDLSSAEMTFRMLDKIKPSIIINLAGLTDVDLCERQIDLAYLANTYSVENIVGWIQGRGNCHLIHISTDHIYDGIGPHTETDIAIKNNYALSKYAGELAAMRVSSTILRTNFIGRSLAGHRESLVDWIYKSLVSQKKIQVFNDIFFSPLSISLLSQLIELVLEKKKVGTFNLGSKNGMSKADFAQSFAENLQYSIDIFERVSFYGGNSLDAYRPKDMRMNSAKFEEVFKIELPNLCDLIPNIAGEYFAIS
jgi:dTDP-4-dehydrorhamnose reductase